MSLDSDVALFGNGVASLIAASHLLSEGKSVLLLNPDWDFFMEDSELPLDPLWPIERDTLTPDKLLESSPEHALAALRPDFPGAIELWPDLSHAGFHDHLAPHVRTRDRLWLRPTQQSDLDWSVIEDMYVEASDAGLNPRILDGILVKGRFPGFSSHAQFEDLRGILVPKTSDVDVSRYRNGLLEFVRERLGQDKIHHNVSQLEFISSGIRFHSKDGSNTAHIKEGLLAFWTPRISTWVLAQAEKKGVSPELPSGLRFWEQWSLVSKEPLDYATIGVYENMLVWAEVEGSAEINSPNNICLSVLKPGPLHNLDGVRDMPWASAESFGALSRLCYGLLKWEKFSIRSMRPRAILEWKQNNPARSHWTLDGPIVVCGSDGPLVDVVRSARSACRMLIGAEVHAK